MLYTAESLNVLAQWLSFLLGEQMKIALLAMWLVAACKGADKLMAQISPGGYGVVRQVHEPGSDIGLEYQREEVGKDLVVPSPGSLHRDGVDVEKLRRMRLAVVLLWYIWFEILCAGPLDLPQLTGERRTTSRVRQIAWFPWRMHVNRGPSALVGLTSRFSSTLDAGSSVFLLSFMENLALVATSSWVRRRGGAAVGVDPASQRFWPS